MTLCDEEIEPLLQKHGERSSTEVLLPAGELSFSGAVIALLCTSVGAGTVVVPRAFSFSGWFAGLLALTVSAALTMLSLSCLFQCAQAERGPSTFQSLAQKHLPRGLSAFVEVAIIALLLGAIGSMLLLSLHVLEVAQVSAGFVHLRQSHLSGTLFMVALLVCLPRKFSELEWVSIVNLVSTVSVVAIICVQCAEVFGAARSVAPSVGTSVPVVFATTSPSGLLAALPLTLYVFFCQILAPQIYSELRPCYQRRASLAGVLAIVACLVIYASVGLLGYAAFGSGVQGDVMVQLTRLDPGNMWLRLGQTLFGIVLLLSTPLVVTPLRSMIIARLGKVARVEAADVSFSLHLSTTAAILVLALLIALSVPGVDLLMGILGSTCVVFLGLVVPGLLTLNCCGNDWKIAGSILLAAGLLLTPLMLVAVVAQQLGYLPQ